MSELRVNGTFPVLLFAFRSGSFDALCKISDVKIFKGRSGSFDALCKISDVKIFKGLQTAFIQFQPNFMESVVTMGYMALGASLIHAIICLAMCQIYIFTPL